MSENDHHTGDSPCDVQCDDSQGDVPARPDGGGATVSTDTRQFIDEIGADLDQGELPLRVYNDPEIFELEMDRIFGNSWVFVGHETEIPEEGDYIKRYIGTDPFIFTRDEDGEIHLLFDSCRHRGAKVCRAEKGNASHFRCPYHGWTYKNNGELAAIPQQEDAYEGMDLSEWGLIEVPQLTNYKGLVFAAINEDVPDFEEYIGDFKWYLDIHLNLTDGGMAVIGDPFRYRINSNWKVGAENFAGDGYHTHTTHRSAIDTFVDQEWSWEGDRDYQFISEVDGYYNGSTLMGLFQDDDIDAFWGYPEEVKQHFNPDNLTEEQWDIARRSAIHVATVFPNVSIHHQNATPPGGRPLPFFSIRKWMPRGPDQMEVLNLILAPTETPQEWKDRIHQAAVYTFGPSGNFDQDDVAVWSGITDAAGGTFSTHNDVKLNYKMGMGDIGKAELDEDWAGPGYASDTIHEGYSRTYHRNWVKAMQQPPGTDGHEDGLTGVGGTENVEADD